MCRFSSGVTFLTVMATRPLADVRGEISSLRCDILRRADAPSVQQFGMDMSQPQYINKLLGDRAWRHRMETFYGKQTFVKQMNMPIPCRDRWRSWGRGSRRGPAQTPLRARHRGVVRRAVAGEKGETVIAGLQIVQELLGRREIQVEHGSVATDWRRL